MKTVYDLWLAIKMLDFRKDVRPLCEAFKSSYDVFAHSFEADSDSLYLSEGCVRALMDKNLTKAISLVEKCARLNIAAVPYHSEFYPAFLKDIENPPYLLFVKGDARVLKERFCVSTVGTRRMTPYGKYCAFKLSYDIASVGGVIVSGMARGIDSVTHAAALTAGGKTIAVLGCGVDVIYPPEHRVLYNSIIKSGGAIVSEYLPGTSPQPRFFPQRNRIICGISYTTVVVEAPKGSGALITAGEAIKEGREVFALPGNISAENAYGTNELIQGGARLIRNSEELLAEYKNISGIRLNPRIGKKAPATAEICDRAIDEFKVASDKPRESVNDAEAKKIFSSDVSASAIRSGGASGSNADFPVSVYMSNGTSKFKASKKLAEKQKPTAKDASDKCEENKNESTRSVSSENKTVGYNELVEECESFGIVMDDEMKKVCKVLSENEKITVDVLHHNGCSTKASLQALTILSQTGRVEETVGGVYIIRRS